MSINVNKANNQFYKIVCDINKMPPEIITVIVAQCFDTDIKNCKGRRVIKNFRNLQLTNKQLCDATRSLSIPFFCPNLTYLNTEILNTPIKEAPLFDENIQMVIDECSQKISDGVSSFFDFFPSFTFLNTENSSTKKPNKCALINGYWTLAPLVENNAGISYFLISKNCTTDKLTKIAQSKKIFLIDSAAHFRSIQEGPDIKDPYYVMITNEVTKDSLKKTTEEQSQVLRKKKTKQPNFQELLTFQLFTENAAPNSRTAHLGRTSTAHKQGAVQSAIVKCTKARGQTEIHFHFISQKDKNERLGTHACRRI
jgi:hypothetical protein